MFGNWTIGDIVQLVMYVLPWLSGGVVIAIIVGLIVAPVLVQSIFQWLLRCKPCLIVIAIAAVFAAGWWFGRDEAVKECREAQVRAELEAKLRDKQFDTDQAKKAAADAALIAEGIKTKADKQHADDQKYIDELKSKPMPQVCGFSDGDAASQPARRSKRLHRPALHITWPIRERPADPTGEPGDESAGPSH